MTSPSFLGFRQLRVFWPFKVFLRSAEWPVMWKVARGPVLTVSATMNSPTLAIPVSSQPNSTVTFSSRRGFCSWPS